MQNENTLLCSESLHKPGMRSRGNHFDGPCSDYFSSREVYDCYCDSGSEQNVLAAPAPAPVLAKMSDTGGSCFCCMGHGPFFNYYLLTLVNKFSSAGALVSSPVPTPAALVSSLTRDADQHH